MDMEILDLQEEMKRQEACRIPTEQDDIPFILPAVLTINTGVGPNPVSVDIDNIDSFLKIRELGVRIDTPGISTFDPDWVFSLRESSVAEPLIGVTDTPFDRVSMGSLFGSLNPTISFRASPWVFSPGITITLTVEFLRTIVFGPIAQFDFGVIGTILRRRRPLPLKLPPDAIPYTQTLRFSSIAGGQIQDRTFLLNTGEFNFVMTSWGFDDRAPNEMRIFLRDEASGQPFMTENRVFPSSFGVRAGFSYFSGGDVKNGPSIFRLPTWWFIPAKGSLYLEIENIGVTQSLGMTVSGFRTRRRSLEEAVS